MTQGFINQSSTYSTTIIGVTNGSSAASGIVGEMISSVVLSSSPVSLTSGVATNLTSIALTPGDWMIWGNIQYVGAGGVVMTYTIAAINSVSATLPDQAYWTMGGSNSTSTSIGQIAPARSANITTPTTYYLVGQSVYSTAALGMAGQLIARRMR